MLCEFCVRLPFLCMAHLIYDFDAILYGKLNNDYILLIQAAAANKIHEISCNWSNYNLDCAILHTSNFISKYNKKRTDSSVRNGRFCFCTTQRVNSSHVSSTIHNTIAIKTEIYPHDILWCLDFCRTTQQLEVWNIFSAGFGVSPCIWIELHTRNHFRSSFQFFSHFFACFSQIVIWILFVSNKFQNISFFRAHYYYGAAFQSEIKGMPWRRTHKQNRWIRNISFKWSLLTVTFYALCWCLEIHFYVCKKQTSQQQQQNMSPIKLNLNFDILAPRMTKGNIQYNSFASHSASLQGSQWLSQFFTFHCYCLPTGAYV